MTHPQSKVTINKITKRATSQLSGTPTRHVRVLRQLTEPNRLINKWSIFLFQIVIRGKRTLYNIRGKNVYKPISYVQVQHLQYFKKRPRNCNRLTSPVFRYCFFSQISLAKPKSAILQTCPLSTRMFLAAKSL